MLREPVGGGFPEPSFHALPGIDRARAHVAARVQCAAGPGEILVSGTVRDLTAGSGVLLVDRGVHELKGPDGDWALFAVEG